MNEDILNTFACLARTFHLGIAFDLGDDVFVRLCEDGFFSFLLQLVDHFLLVSQISLPDHKDHRTLSTLQQMSITLVSG
jgi:hypothetical protein